MVLQDHTVLRFRTRASAAKRSLDATMVDPADDAAIWSEFDALDRELGEDLAFFYRARRYRSRQLWRRAYCRAVSAYFEAMTSWMARYTILFYHPAQLGDDERQSLEARVAARERAFRALDLFTNTAGAQSPLERGSSNWIVLSRMIQIRNRLVHPNRSSDVLVSDDELQCIERAARVVQYLVSESLRRSSCALLKSFDAIQRRRLQREASNQAKTVTAVSPVFDFWDDFNTSALHDALPDRRS